MEIDAVSSVEFNDTYVTEEREETSDLHKSIFSPNHHHKFSRNATQRSHSNPQIGKLAHTRILSDHPYESRRSNWPDAKFESGVTASWGGPIEGVKIDTYVNGKLTDQDGNFVSGHYERTNDGINNVSFSTGIDTSKKITKTKGYEKTGTDSLLGSIFFHGVFYMEMPC
jgi:hypothetical protein